MNFHTLERVLPYLDEYDEAHMQGVNRMARAKIKKEQDSMNSIIRSFGKLTLTGDITDQITLKRMQDVEELLNKNQNAQKILTKMMTKGECAEDYRDLCAMVAFYRGRVIHGLCTTTTLREKTMYTYAAVAPLRTLMQDQKGGFEDWMKRIFEFFHLFYDDMDHQDLPEWQVVCREKPHEAVQWSLVKPASEFLTLATLRQLVSEHVLNYSSRHHRVPPDRLNQLFSSARTLRWLLVREANTTFNARHPPYEGLPDTIRIALRSSRYSQDLKNLLETFYVEHWKSDDIFYAGATYIVNHPECVYVVPFLTYLDQRNYPEARQERIVREDLNLKGVRDRIWDPALIKPSLIKSRFQCIYERWVSVQKEYLHERILNPPPVRPPIHHPVHLVEL